MTQFRHSGPRIVPCNPAHDPGGHIPQVRIRITKALQGSIDGIQLSRFVMGLTYDVGTSLGNYLLASGGAVPVDKEEPALVLPLDDPLHEIAKAVTPSISIDKAADRESRKRR